jgi:VWFA-related protein
METSRSQYFLVALVLLLLLAGGAQAQDSSPQETQKTSTQPDQSGQVTVPARPAEPLYKGQQGKQGSEIEFAPSSRDVTIKLQVQDPNGYFVPNLRRDNFAVYEDGVRQKDVTVEIERAPISAALLMEYGGRYRELEKALAMEVQNLGRPFLDVLGREDKVAIFTYDATLHTLADFNEDHKVLDAVFDHLSAPDSPDANFYDALLETLSRMRNVNGRKVIIVLSTGVDTFSKANFDQVLQAARQSGIPIYAISLDNFAKLEAAVYGPTVPRPSTDWSAAEKQLEQIAAASGARAYEPETDLEVAAIYDDIMENLRTRYVITYVSSNPATAGPARKIRVELVDPTSGQPLKIRDANGKTVTAKVFVKDSYAPSSSSGG